MSEPGSPPPPASWVAPLLRTIILVGIVALVWLVAGHWDRWTGAAALQSSDDAYIAGDLTPLSAKVAGYIRSVAVDDFQAVRKGELIAEIDPADYQAQLDLSQAGLAAAQANLANLANQREVQKALVRQAEASIAALAW